jgi:hypothetical protein
VETWLWSAAVEASGGAPRAFHRSFAAGEDLLHSLVDPRASIMRDMTTLDAWWFQSHRWLLSRLSPG